MKQRRIEMMRNVVTVICVVAVVIAFFIIFLGFGFMIAKGIQ